MKYTEYFLLAALLTPTVAVLTAALLSLASPNSDDSPSQAVALSAHLVPIDSIAGP
jgi:hypothetical protein